MSANRFAPGCECCDKPECLHSAYHDGTVFVQGDDPESCTICAIQWNLFVLNAQIAGSCLTHPDYDPADYTGALLIYSAVDSTADEAVWKRANPDKPMIIIRFALPLELVGEACLMRLVGYSIDTPCGTITYTDSGEVDESGHHILCQYETVGEGDDTYGTLTDADGGFGAVFSPLIRRRIFWADDILDYTFSAESGGWITGESTLVGYPGCAAGEFREAQAGSAETMNENTYPSLTYLSAGTLVDNWYLDATFFGTGDALPLGTPAATSCTYRCSYDAPEVPDHEVTCVDEDITDDPSCLLMFVDGQTYGGGEWDPYQATAPVVMYATGGYVTRTKQGCNDTCIYCCGANINVENLLESDVRCITAAGGNSSGVLTPLDGSEFQAYPGFIYRPASEIVIRANGSTFLRATEDV